LKEKQVEQERLGEREAEGGAGEAEGRDRNIRTRSRRGCETSKKL
jgi:hypothetical protein